MEQPLDTTALALRQAVEHFIEAADSSDTATVALIYAPDFLNVRVVDDGDVVRLKRDQILAIFQSGGYSIPTQSTTVHHLETSGDTGFVLLSRLKDLGHGWEPMFYSLVWTHQEGTWLLRREFVHQRTLPTHRRA